MQSTGDADIVCAQVDGARGLAVNLAHAGLVDADAAALAERIGAAAERAFDADAGAPIPTNLFLEQSFLGDAGVVALFEALAAFARARGARRRLRVRLIRLHMCRVGDGGARALAAFLLALPAHAPDLPWELHLSHNRVSTDGCRELLAAVAARYPRADERGRPVPLWLRLEHNAVDTLAVRRDAGAIGVRWCACTRPQPPAAPGAARGGAFVGARDESATSATAPANDRVGAMEAVGTWK